MKVIKWIQEDKWRFVAILCFLGMVVTYGEEAFTFSTFSALFAFATIRYLFKI